MALRVLFLSGHPRPGRNEFGAEAACIRQVLVGGLVHVRELAMVGLAELCPVVDEHTPAILHIAAHSSFSGVHLSQDGNDLCIGYEDLCREIARVRFPPRLVILNICDSLGLAAEMSRSVGAVIGWPGTLNDPQAQVFAQHLYRSLARHRSVADSCKDAEAALSGPHPDCAPPVSHGNTDRPVL
ncbi:CHAT domain-containing protein [Streptomyces polyrhachis]|uniref:CHAT domain-containing protein n=1 Tax=Streptomyces polyrhachis TaxID=1282885 RepID=A0ABW2GK52_9ACTN